MVANRVASISSGRLHVVAYLLAAALVVAFLPPASPRPAAVAVTSEIEPNSSFSAANVIQLGTTYSGSSSGASRRDNDYFAVDVPSAGRATLNLKFPANSGKGFAYYVYVYGAAREPLYNFDVLASASSGAWLAAQATFLPKGRAYIRIVGYSNLLTWGKTYTLNVGYTPANVETEPNDTVATANVIKLGTTYSGSSLDMSGNDEDFFAVDVPSAGRATVNLKFPANLGTGDAYYLYVYGAAGEPLYNFNVPAAGGSGAWLAAKSTILPKGRAYIRIVGYSSLSTWGKKYTLNVSVPVLALKATPVPTISGAAKVASVLTATAGTWAPARVALKYQWVRNGKAISGATGATYKLVAADAGSKVAVTVTGSKTGYKTVVTTSVAKSVPLQALTATPVPTISGTAKVASVLTAKAGTWAPAPVTLKYQWLRNGKAITGAAKSTYKLLAADAGKKITVTVAGSKAGYRAITKTSVARTIAK